MCFSIFFIVPNNKIVYMVSKGGLTPLRYLFQLISGSESKSNECHKSAIIDVTLLLYSLNGTMTHMQKLRCFDKYSLHDTLLSLHIAP